MEGVGGFGARRGCWTPKQGAELIALPKPSVLGELSCQELPFFLKAHGGMEALPICFHAGRGERVARGLDTSPGTALALS